MAAAGTDEALARRVQELEDEEFARRIQKGSPLPPTPTQQYSYPVQDELEAELQGYLTPEHRVFVNNPRPTANRRSPDQKEVIVIDTPSPGLTEDEIAVRKLIEEEDRAVAMRMFHAEENEMLVDRLYRGVSAAPASYSVSSVPRFSRPPRGTLGAGFQTRSSIAQASPPPSYNEPPPFMRRRGTGFGGRMSREEMQKMAEAERALESNDYEALLALEEKMGKVERGVSGSQLHAFPLGKWNAPPAQCTICMEDFQQGTPFRTLPCLDKFHPDCIDRWLKTHVTCPVCRHELAK